MKKIRRIIYKKPEESSWNVIRLVSINDNGFDPRDFICQDINEPVDSITREIRFNIEEQIKNPL